MDCHVLVDSETKKVLVDVDTKKVLVECGGCPCGLTLTFNEVDVSCCVRLGEPGHVFISLTGSGTDGSFNGTPITLDIGEIHNDNCDGCFGNLGVDGGAPNLITNTFWTLDNCTGDIISSGNDTTVWHVAFVAGIWYVLVLQGNDTGAVLFSGSTTDISNPIENDCVQCEYLDAFEVSNPIVQCIFPASGGTITRPVGAFGGTVTIDLNVPCGCCVRFGQCTVSSESQCLSLAGEWSEGDCTDICGPCCYFGDCYYDVESDCTPFGGEWFGPAANDCDTRIC